MIIEDERRRRRVTVISMILGGVAVVALSGGVSLFVSTFREPFLMQPLSITACIPDSYQAPGAGERGPVQGECARWFTPRDDTWDVNESIVVAGQVCNDSEEAVSYEVEVAFERVLEEGDQTRVIVINTPITYDPGCQDPYEFPFEVPLVLRESDQELGNWRIVGRAIPTDRNSYAVYQWDVTATVELVS